MAAFCAGLGLDPTAAFAILERHRPAPRVEPLLDPDVEALVRRLTDPQITEAERFHIRETVRYLAYRPALPAISTAIGRTTLRNGLSDPDHHRRRWRTTITSAPRNLRPLPAVSTAGRSEGSNMVLKWVSAMVAVAAATVGGHRERHCRTAHAVRNAVGGEPVARGGHRHRGDAYRGRAEPAPGRPDRADFLVLRLEKLENRIGTATPAWWRAC